MATIQSLRYSFLVEHFILKQFSLNIKNRFEIEDDNYLNLDKQTNVHILTGTAKLFFRYTITFSCSYSKGHILRELRTPLISWDLMRKLINALRKYENNKEEMVKHSNEILNKLDRFHK